MSRDEAFESAVREASRGHAPAVDELLERYLARLESFLRVRAGVLLERETAADLVQSVCRDVLENRDRFRHDGEPGFRRWLFKTAYRKIADRHEFWSAGKRRPPAGAVPLDGDHAEAVLEVYGSFCSPSRLAIAREEVGRVERALASMPEEDREIIALAKIAGLPRAAIAEELGKTEAAVRTQLHRALARLADELADD